MKFLHHPHSSFSNVTNTEANVAEARLLPDSIVNIKHSSLAWYKNLGIFYNRYDDKDDDIDDDKNDADGIDDETDGVKDVDNDNSRSNSDVKSTDDAIHRDDDRHDGKDNDDDDDKSSCRPPQVAITAVNQRQKLCFHRLSETRRTRNLSRTHEDDASEKSADNAEKMKENEKDNRGKGNDKKENSSCGSADSCEMDVISFPSHPEWHVSCRVTECQTYLVCLVRDRCRQENLVWIGVISEILAPMKREDSLPSSASPTSSSSSLSSSLASSSTSSTNAHFRFRFDDWAASFLFVTNVEKDFYFRTNLHAEFYSLVRFRLDDCSNEKGCKSCIVDECHSEVSREDNALWVETV